MSPPPKKKPRKFSPHRKRKADSTLKPDDPQDLLSPMKMLKLETTERSCDLTRALRRVRDLEDLHRDHDINSSKVKYRPTTFHINIQSGRWFEAFTTHELLLQYDKYPHLDIMMAFVKIILNTHENEYEYKTNKVLSMCSDALYKIFSTYRSSSVKIRSIYKDFLRDSEFWLGSSADEQIEDCGLFVCLLNLLEKELPTDTPPKPEPDFIGKNLTFQDVNILKKQYETYDSLAGRDKTRRLFLILDALVFLLESDLFAWYHRYESNIKSGKTVTYKPLIVSVVCQQNDADICSKIFKLYVDSIRYNRFQKNVDTLSRLMNLASYMMYIRDANEGVPYPEIGKNCVEHAKTLFEILKKNDAMLIIRSIDGIKSDYLQYLLSYYALKNFTRSKKKFEDLLMDTIERRVWNSLPTSKSTLKTVVNGDFDKSIFFGTASRDVRKSLRATKSAAEDEEICDMSFLLLCFCSFKSYLAFHNVLRIETDLRERRATNVYELNLKTDDRSSRRDLSEYGDVFKNVKRILKIYRRVGAYDADVEYFFKHFDAIEMNY